MLMVASSLLEVAFLLLYEGYLSGFSMIFEGVVTMLIVLPFVLYHSV